ncbi:probable G-protein coupled receptor CG31760 [Mercenaria mercenaria]|uniref:probable G-protein coupled receptor CG31760 n=1 Tax=Mercenaria mercenaria TaxID=6596 RepID=UPI00234E4E3F|nr:probable G-protein coupled receptor CG31760 [Mercenaria mercenaria]
MNICPQVIKSASPAFLELMCLGGILVCSQFFTELLETNVLMCTIRIWPQHVGFVILYGSLVIKTWRISMIFTIGARKRVSLPDAVLHKRLAILLLAAIAILAVWTTSSPPEISALRTSDNLIFYVCKFGIWEYTVIGAEVILLLYGVYLSFTIRKAPAQFSDKFMAYAIYNAIILGLVMSLVSRLFIPVTGPDMILVLEFVQVQVYASVTLLIIFIPKFLAVRKERNNQVCKAIMSQTSILAAAGRFKSSPSVAMDLNVNFLNYMVEQVEKSTQTTENIEKQTAE